MALSSDGRSVLPEMTQDEEPSEKKASSGATQSKIRRRNRMITSCLECRRRKLKCDKLHPCTNCSKFARDCTFLAPALDSASQMKLTEIKEKMGTLERVLESDVAQKTTPKASRRADLRRPSTELPGQEDTDSDEGPVPEDEKGLEATPLAVVDAAYEDDADEDMLDLGIRVGKMRLTERLGGYFRPKMSEELSFTLSDPTHDRRTAEEKSAGLPASPHSGEGFLEPGPTYIAPSSGFVLGDIGLRRSLMDFLPSKLASDTLVEQYYRNVHAIAKLVHWPSFQVQYDNFWTNVLMGIEPTASAQALIFSVMFAAVASMAEADVSATFQRPKRTVLANLQTGTEVSLGKAQFLRTTKIETLQALIIYLIPMCRIEVSRAHSVLVGTAIRLAECMGLHRDPEKVYGMSPIECHVRRTMWFQICFLDFRTAEAQGPRPGVRRDDYDTQFPMNINDRDLLSAKPVETENVWTDMTFTRIRFECNEMHRVVWVDRVRLEKKQISITHVLGKIESFRRAMEAKYHPIIDDTVPIQNLARLVMAINLLRMHVMVLHRYHNSVTTRIPDRLRQIILTSGTQHMEYAVKVETQPEFAPWQWYAGAWSQWTTAFLLLAEIYTFPMRREADRIWAVCDYVFEPDRTLSRAQKGRQILGDLRDRIAVYRDMRKVKAPISMTSRLNVKPQPKPGGRFDGGAPANAVPPTRTPAAPAAFDFNTPEPGRGLSPYAALSEGSNESASPHHTADASFHTWSYDSPSTFFVHQKDKDGSMPIPGWGTRQASSSAATDQAGPGFTFLGSPPSEISTTESWPPLISSQQQGWNAHLQTYGGLNNMSAMGNVPPVKSQYPGTAGITYAVVDAPMNNDQPPGNLAGMGQGYDGDPMALDIDWNEWDKLFPPNVNTGELNMPESVTMS